MHLDQLVVIKVYPMAHDILTRSIPTSVFDSYHIASYA